MLCEVVEYEEESSVGNNFANRRSNSRSLRSPAAALGRDDNLEN
jgi:hypothetical protein